VLPAAHSLGGRKRRLALHLAGRPVEDDQLTQWTEVQYLGPAIPIGIPRLKTGVEEPGQALALRLTGDLKVIMPGPQLGAVVGVCPNDTEAGDEVVEEAIAVQVCDDDAALSGLRGHGLG
jgi:hypothetical protein